MSVTDNAVRAVKCNGQNVWRRRGDGRKRLGGHFLFLKPGSFAIGLSP